MSVPALTSPALTTPAPPSATSELVALARLAGPLVGANLLQMAVSAVDVIFVARLGTVDLAAATLAVFLFNLLMYAIIGLGSASAALIAAELGARSHAVREVRRSFRMALWVAAIAALPVVAILLNGEHLLLLVGQDPEVARRAGGFLHIIVWALVPGAAAGILRSTAAALGRPFWAFVVTGAALAINIVANWAFIRGHLGMPAMGLNGSAVATVVSLTAMLIGYVAIVLTDRHLRRYRLFGRWWRPEWPRFVQIVRLGTPIAVTWMFEGALFGGAAVLMGRIGVAEVAAHAIALNIAAVAFQVPFGVAQATTIRVGMAFGARDPEWIARAGWTAIVAGTGFMALTAAMMWAAPRLLISIYIDLDDPRDAVVIGLAVQYLAIAALFQLVDGAQAVAAGALRGLQDTRVPMIVAGIGYWVVGFGTSILLGFQFGWAGVGIWGGLAAGLAFVSAVLVWRWSRRGGLGLLPVPA